MRTGKLCYIDLFDEYTAMRISHNELTDKVDSDYPHLELESELEWYAMAIETLQLRAHSLHIQNIHDQESGSISA